MCVCVFVCVCLCVCVCVFIASYLWDSVIACIVRPIRTNYTVMIDGCNINKMGMFPHTLSRGEDTTFEISILRTVFVDILMNNGKQSQYKGWGSPDSRFIFTEITIFFFCRKINKLIKNP